jgi:hypothetical protein
LNPTHTGSSAPPGAADPNYYLKGGRRGKKSRKGTRKGRKQRGQRGGAQLAPATYGVGNVDSMYYYAPTAGYANTASTWKDSVGAPVQIQVPFAARSMNQACLSTGGHPPLTGALQKGGKNSRKGGAFYGIPTSMSNLQGLFGMGSAAAAAAPEADAEIPSLNASVPENVGPVANVGPATVPTSLPAPTGPGLMSPNNNNTNINPPVTPGVAPPSTNNDNALVVGGKRHKKAKKGKKGTHKRKH